MNSYLPWRCTDTGLSPNAPPRLDLGTRGLSRAESFLRPSVQRPTSNPYSQIGSTGSSSSGCSGRITEASYSCTCECGKPYICRNVRISSTLNTSLLASHQRKRRLWNCSPAGREALVEPAVPSFPSAALPPCQARCTSAAAPGADQEVNAPWPRRSGSIDSVARRGRSR